MVYYAIRNKITRDFISGTDFDRADGKKRQIMATAINPPKLFTGVNLNFEIKQRGINLNRYEVVAVEIKEAEKCSK